MLEVEYEISRKEGDNHNRIFTIDDKLKNVNGNAIYVKAPNARGKSTFLNMLALAFYGDRLEDTDCRISESLRHDIEYMAQRDSQDYTFDVVLTSKDGTIKLTSSKKNAVSKDIRVQETIDSETNDIPLQTFKDKYFLVYDIPEDPLNRVTEILADVKNQQNRYHKKISDFRNYLGEVKSEIARSRNDDEIAQLKSTLSKYTTQEEDSANLIKELEEEYRVLGSYLSLREFGRYMFDSTNLMQAIEDEGQKLIKKRTTAKRFNTQYEHKKEDIESDITRVKLSINSLTSTLERLFINRNLEQIKVHTSKIKSLNFAKSLKSYHIEDNINSDITFLKKSINSYLAEKEIRESGKKGSFYHDLIKIFEQYSSVDISLPGFDKNINELVHLLKKESENNKTLKSIYDDLKKSLELISNIESDIDKIESDLESLKILYGKREKSIRENNENIIDDNIDEINQELQPILIKIEYYKNLAKANGIIIDENTDPSEISIKQDEILSQYPKYSNIYLQAEDSYLIELQKRQKDIEDHNIKHKNLLSIKSQNEAKLRELESREPHKYHSYSAQIDNLSKLIDVLDQNFTKYEDIIHKIAEGKQLSSDNEIRYNEAVSSYFANKIPEFPYIDEFLKPTKIDFLKKTILLEGGREIDMKDISTGQSMSMYIQAILNRPEDDKRRMIVIFDEGSTMDSNSLQPIQNILEKQIDQNKILLAVFAKAVDEELTIEKLY
ncbi:hypothetical protein [uncultured Methanolobus sp.]|uniref:hypothetical protein n=1 Tax=uncultured Methanolobus sp. TaxID=218300 RepID=UPI002AAAA69A|nr:hypothetical protein [uncultured Methanolobus sp.]